MSAIAAVRQTEGDQGGIHLLTLTERFWLSVTGCRDHNWSFPQTDKKNMGRAYAAHRPNDSHQQCTSCGSMRLFNSQTMESGPLFTKEVKQNG